MLEDELRKVEFLNEYGRVLTWGLNDLSYAGCNSLFFDNLAQSHYDCMLKNWEGSTKEGKEVVVFVYALIREHLLEALTSQHPYIRRWGQLLMEESNVLRRTSY